MLIHPWLRIFSLACLSVLTALASAVIAEEPALKKTDVFTSGEGGYFSYRIPALVTAPDGTLLVFCEGRKTSRSDDGDIDMLMRRSTDNGKTWQPVQVVHEEGGDAAVKLGNPNPIVDQERGTIVLQMNRSQGERRSERSGGDVLQSISKDNGKSWSKPCDITSQVKKKAWRGYALGPGIGIQLQHGPHKGRLIAPANYRVTFSNRDPSFSHVIYSDDHGENWKLGGIVGEHTNECQVAETYADGKSGLLINMRNHWGRAGKPELAYVRLQANSNDGGLNWNEPKPHQTLIEPTCQASLLRYSYASMKNEQDRSILLFCNPASKGRENLTIRASFDEGKTWPVSKVIEPGPAAYSCMTRLKDGRIGVIYEGEDYGTLTFVAFPVDWLEAK